MYKIFGFFGFGGVHSLVSALALNFRSAGSLDARITFTRASSATDTDAVGALQTLTTDVARANTNQDHSAALVPLGFQLENTRTNSLPNNTMVGAVASVARNIGTITSVTRTASTTVVVASVGHTVIVGDAITCSGATPADYNGTYRVSAIVANVSYSYVVLTSATDAASGYTISAVSPGTRPTGWSAFSVGTASSSISNVTTTNGIDIFDLRLAGIVSTSPSIIFVNTTVIDALTGQDWSSSAFFAIVAGSITNITGISQNIGERTAAGALVKNNPSVFTLSSTLTRQLSSVTLSGGATVAKVTNSVSVTATPSTYIDITIRIGLPDLERGSSVTSVIKTTVAAVTRAVDVATMTGSNFSSWYPATARTFFVQFDLEGVSGTRPIISLDDNSANQQIRLYASGTSLMLTITNGGVTQADLTLGIIAANTTYKVAFTVALNDYRAIMTGGSGQAGSGTVPAVDRLRLGADQAGNVQNGHILELDCYAGALSTPQLSSWVNS